MELWCAHGHASLIAAGHAQTGKTKLLGRQFGSQVVFLGWSPNGQYAILLKDAPSDAGAALVSVADDSVIALNVPGDVYNVALSHDGTRLVYSLTRGLGSATATSSPTATNTLTPTATRTPPSPSRRTPTRTPRR